MKAVFRLYQTILNEAKKACDRINKSPSKAGMHDLESRLADEVVQPITEARDAVRACFDGNNGVSSADIVDLVAKCLARQDFLPSATFLSQALWCRFEDLIRLCLYQKGLDCLALGGCEEHRLCDRLADVKGEEETKQVTCNIVVFQTLRMAEKVKPEDL